MIPVGTPCYIRTSNYPRLTGHVCIVISHGSCGRRHRNDEAQCSAACRVRLVNEEVEPGQPEVCVQTWSVLVPIVPPAPAVSVIRRRRIQV